MRIFRSLIGKVWLLLIVPIVLAGLAALAFLLIILGHLGHAVFGPPSMWDTPRGTPAEAELVGKYRETGRELDQPEPGAPATLELHADGTMQVSGLPNETCRVSGSGTWEGHAANSSVTLTVHSDGAKDSCESGGYYDGVKITGRNAPYGLYWGVGDPDSGTGVRLKRQ